MSVTRLWSLYSNNFLFLDVFSHLYKRVCPSVGPSVGRSVRRSVGRSVTHELNFWEMGKIEQNSIRNKKVCHLKDDSKTSTRAVRQRMHLLSELCSTCSFLFRYGPVIINCVQFLYFCFAGGNTVKSLLAITLVSGPRMYRQNREFLRLVEWCFHFQ